MTGIRKNDVIVVNLSGAIGSEQKHTRIAVVIQNNNGNKHSPTTLIMPFTHVLKGLHIPTHSLVKKSEENGLNVDSMLLGEQMRCISEERIIKKIGHITDENVLNEIRRVYYANFGE